MSTGAFAEAFPAGEYLADELEARGWTQAEFAEVLGRPTQFVSEIISGRRDVTRESAAEIGDAFGTSAELWHNLQETYHIWSNECNKRKGEARPLTSEGGSCCENSFIGEATP